MRCDPEAAPVVEDPPPKGFFEAGFNLLSLAPCSAAADNSDPALDRATGASFERARPLDTSSRFLRDCCFSCNWPRGGIDTLAT